jgi:hypothetical protein
LVQQKLEQDKDGEWIHHIWGGISEDLLAKLVQAQDELSTKEAELAQTAAKLRSEQEAMLDLHTTSSTSAATPITGIKHPCCHFIMGICQLV